MNKDTPHYSGGNMIRPYARKTPLSVQKGSALVVSLIMLLVMSMLGLTAMQSTTLQERMAGNMRDRNLAFQAAEAALRVGQDNLQNAQQPVANHAAAATWENFFIGANGGTALILDNRLASPPRYAVEVLPTPSSELLEADSPLPPPSLFRVTARAEGGTDVAVVVLQAVVRR